MTEALQILILDDNPADATLVQFELQEAGLAFQAKIVMTEKDYVQELQECSPDLILSDYALPSYNGALALAEARKRCPDTPFILVSGAVSEDHAIEILTHGAKDYVLKTRLHQRLAPAVRRVLAEAEEQRARKQAEAELREAYRTMEDMVKIRTAELKAEMAARKKIEEVLWGNESREIERFTEMQRRTEELMNVNEAVSSSSHLQEDMQKLLQKMQICQIKLEMQNEELSRYKNETDVLMAKYRDIYDFAPIGYFTLNPNGNVVRVNLTGAGLIGVVRSRLIGQEFRLHLSDECGPVFDAFFRKTIEGETIESCEVMLRNEGSPARFVRLVARLSEDKEECHMDMIDITKRKLSEEKESEHSR